MKLQSPPAHGIMSKKGLKMDWKIILIFLFGFLFGFMVNDNSYIISHSQKVNCDILLNTKTGDTWYNNNGFWEKSSKDIIEKHL